MKIAFYWENGFQQFVLTPEDDYEKDMLAKLHDHDYALTVCKGGFYHCEGGYLRESAARSDTMLVLNRKD